MPQSNQVCELQQVNKASFGHFKRSPKILLQPIHKKAVIKHDDTDRNADSKDGQDVTTRSFIDGHGKAIGKKTNKGKSKNH